MAWHRHPSNHYFNICWPRSMALYCAIAPQWVDNLASETIFSSMQAKLLKKFNSLHKITQYGFDKQVRSHYSVWLVLSFKTSLSTNLKLLSVLKCIALSWFFYLTHRGPVDLRKLAIFNTILMSPKSWLSQEDLDAGCEHSLVPMDS